MSGRKYFSIHQAWFEQTIPSVESMLTVDDLSYFEHLSSRNHDGESEAMAEMTPRDNLWDDINGFAQAGTIDGDKIVLGCDSVARILAMRHLLTAYADDGLPTLEILRLIAMANRHGENMLHKLRTHEQEIVNWMRWLPVLAMRDKGNDVEAAQIIFNALHQASQDSIRFIDLINFDHRTQVDSYLDCIIYLATQGFTCEQLAPMLQRGEQSLEAALLARAKQLPLNVMLHLLRSGLIADAQLKQFVQHKKDLLTHVVKGFIGTELQVTLLGEVLDPTKSLGKLFLMKASSEFRFLSDKHGLLKIAKDELARCHKDVSSQELKALGVEEQTDEDGFLIMGAEKHRLFQPRQPVAEPVPAPLVLERSSPSPGVPSE